MAIEEIPNSDYVDVVKDGVKETYYSNCATWNVKENAKVFQSTGLKDREGEEGYFNYSIWRVSDYDYRVDYKDGKGKTWKRETKQIDLYFVLLKGLLKVEYYILDKPEDLDTISLNVIFNLKNKEGGRSFIDGYRQNLTVVGDIYNDEDLNDKDKEVLGIKL